MPEGPNMPQLSPASLRRLTRELGRAGPCVLCGAPRAEIPALFCPKKPDAWGAAGVAGKRGVLVYRLCNACFALPGREMALEAKIQASLGAQRN